MLPPTPGAGAHGPIPRGAGGASGLSQIVRVGRAGLVTERCGLERRFRTVELVDINFVVVVVGDVLDVVGAKAGGVEHGERA